MRRYSGLKSIQTSLCGAAAAVLIAAAALCMPVTVCAGEESDPSGITDILTSETEKDKLREALIELERRGLTPRDLWMELRGMAEDGSLPDPGALAEEAREGASGLMENAASQFEQEVEEPLKKNILQRFLQLLTEQWDALFGN